MKYFLLVLCLAGPAFSQEPPESLTVLLQPGQVYSVEKDGQKLNLVCTAQVTPKNLPHCLCFIKTAGGFLNEYTMDLFAGTQLMRTLKYGDILINDGLKETARLILALVTNEVCVLSDAKKALAQEMEKTANIEKIQKKYGKEVHNPLCE